MELTFAAYGLWTVMTDPNAVTRSYTVVFTSVGADSVCECNSGTRTSAGVVRFDTLYLRTFSTHTYGAHDWVFAPVLIR